MTSKYKTSSIGPSTVCQKIFRGQWVTKAYTYRLYSVHFNCTDFVFIRTVNVFNIIFCHYRCRHRHTICTFGNVNVIIILVRRYGGCSFASDSARKFSQTVLECVYCHYHRLHSNQLRTHNRTSFTHYVTPYWIHEESCTCVRFTTTHIHLYFWLRLILLRLLNNNIIVHSQNQNKCHLAFCAFVYLL